MANPWDNDPITPAIPPAQVAAGNPWDNDPINGPAIPAGVSTLSGPPLGMGVGATMDQVEGGGPASAGSTDVMGNPLRPDLPPMAMLADVTRSAANSIPFADRMSAAMDMVGGGSYADNLAREHAEDQFAQSRDPFGYAAGTLAGTAALPMGFMGDAYRGASLGGKVLLGAGTGAAINGLQGASSSPDLTSPGQTLPLMAQGAGYGAAFGGALPIAGAAIGAGVRAATPFFTPRPDGMSRTVFGLLGNSTRQGALDNLDTLGPDAMLADASPSLTGLAQGTAGKDSAARDMMIDALKNRDDGTNYRLMADRYASFGPAISPDQAKLAMTNRMDATDNMFSSALANAPPSIDITPVSQDLNNRVLGAANGGKTQAALNQFEGFLTGPTIQGRQTLEYDPQILQNAKGEMDDAINRLTATPGTAASNRALDAMTGVRANLSDVMGSQIPGFADANLAYGTAAEGLKSFNRGRGMLADGDVWAPDHASAFGQLPLEQQALERAGARSRIEQNAQDTPRDLVAQRQLFGDAMDTRRGKNETYFGAEPTQNYVDSLDRNSQFRNTYQQVAQGSKTQPASASAKIVDTTLDPPPSFADSANLRATAVRVGQQAARAGFRALAGVTSEDMRSQLAQALSAIGPERDAIVNPLAEALARWDSAGASTRQAVSSPGALAAALAAYGAPRDGPQRNR